MNLAYRMKLVATLSVASLASLASLAACSSDDSSTPGGTDAGKDTSVGTTDSGGGVDSGGGTDSGGGVDSGGGTDSGSGDDGSTTSDGGDAGAALSCASYCSTIATNCTGNNKQYQTDAECLTACAHFASGAATDTSGNTLGCRTYHAGLAASATSPHCWHAGPFGFGGCGTACEDFCALTFAYCSKADGFDAGAPPYSTLAECTAACPTFAVPDAGGLPSTYNGSVPATGNTLDCREYHLGNALTSTANQQIHCPHTAIVSAACK